MYVCISDNFAYVYSYLLECFVYSEELLDQQLTCARYRKIVALFLYPVTPLAITRGPGWRNVQPCLSFPMAHGQSYTLECGHNGLHSVYTTKISTIIANAEHLPLAFCYSATRYTGTRNKRRLAKIRDAGDLSGTNNYC